MILVFGIKLDADLVTGSGGKISCGALNFSAPGDAAIDG